MSGEVKVSRGNPRSSSVGEEEDVDEVRYRTTTTLDPSSIIAVEDCGIPLDCASAGDSFKAQDPCDNLNLSLYNVMGQEDRYRQEDGNRVEKGGVGRIVFSTVEKTVINSIDYARNPSNEDDPTFTGTWTPSPGPDTYHEVFVNVDLDSLYAFRLNLQVDECPDTIQSGIYYLSTGNEVSILSPADSLSISASIELLSPTSILKILGTLNYLSSTGSPNSNYSYVDSNLSVVIDTSFIKTYEVNVGPIEDFSTNFTSLVSTS